MFSVKNKGKESDILEVVREKDETQQRYDTLELKYEEVKHRLEIKKNEYSSLKDDIEQKETELKVLESTIEEMKNRQLSSSTLIDAVESVVSSLKDGTTDDSELRKYIKSNFTKEDTLIDALEILQKQKLESMIYICNKMDENNIVEEDLAIIRALENDICVEFLICKSMHSLCTRYLDQMA